MARLLAVLTLVAGALGGLAYLLGSAPSRESFRGTLALSEALGTGAVNGFTRALAPRPFAFPRDHGPHPDYRTEWWYYTGNVETASGRHFGFQVTFFRTALAARPVARRSAWGATQVYMAHFAVTDVARRRFHAAERLSREALGLAGAAAAPFQVWVDAWRVDGQGPGTLPMRLRVAEGAMAVDLVLGSLKAPVFHGDRGWSRKSAEAGNASYYYSLSRMPARGTIRIGGETLAVEGLAWMDREWGTSALAGDQVGWDWFALQLDDGRELMLYRLRRRDGTVDVWSRGTLVEPDGRARDLPPAAVRLSVLAHWVSPRGGTRYPGGWRLAVPDEGLDLEVTPYLEDQELDLTVRYWEGAVRVRGVGRGGPVSGEGYAELTGYAGAVRE